jgi:23S rRNA pseudouridine2605 synthase
MSVSARLVGLLGACYEQTSMSFSLCYHSAYRAATHMSNKTQGERIAKVIARAGLASRREAEAWITSGRVAVNGKVVDSAALNVRQEDRISVDGRPLPVRERTRLFLYHKPRGLLTSHHDARGRPTIFANLPKHLPRLISIGRLDINTEGLLLLSNDGGLARVLELPSTGWLRRYRVRAHGRVSPDELAALRQGIFVGGMRYGSIEASIDRIQGSNLWLTVAMREGKNREVKNVLGHLGLAVNRLIRISFGPFQLGDLAPGDVEEVKTRVLREQIGERIAALGRADFARPRIQQTGFATPASPSPDLTPRAAAARSHKLARKRDASPAGFPRLGEPERARREKRGRRLRPKAD